MTSAYSFQEGLLLLMTVIKQVILSTENTCANSDLVDVAPICAEKEESNCRSKSLGTTSDRVRFSGEEARSVLRFVPVADLAYFVLVTSASYPPRVVRQAATC